MLPVWGAYIWRGLFSESYGIELKQQSTLLDEKNPLGPALTVRLKAGFH